jgi:hypothetical protein
MKRSGNSIIWLEHLLLAIMLVVAVLPFWTMHHLPTTDGAAHLANADIVNHWMRGDTAVYRQYYELNPRFVPNWLGHFVLALLLFIAPPTVAEKIFMSAYLILLPLGVRYAVRSVRRSAGFLALLAVPLSLNWITQQGFYNFSASVVIFFFAMGYWLRRRDRMTISRAVILALLALLLYTGHLSSIMLFAATVFIMACWFGLVRWRNNTKAPDANSGLRGDQDRTTNPIQDFISRNLLTGLALLPAVGLAVWFQHHGFEGKPAGMKLAIRDINYWKDLLKLAFLVSFRAHWERWLARCMALLLAGTLLYVLADKFKTKRWNRRDGFILLPLALVALYFTQGSAAQQELFIPQRLVYYTCLTFLLFLAGQRFSRWARLAIMCGAAVLTLGFTAAHWKPMHEYARQIDEYIDAGDHMPRGETILPLVFMPHGSPPVVDLKGLRVDPFFSIDQFIAIERGAIDLRNYEASLDYFPVRFHSPLNPRIHLALPGTKLFQDVPQHVDIAHYEQIGGRVDNVLLWGLDSSHAEQRDASTRQTLEYIRAHYELIYHSPDGCAQLWHRKGS